MKRSVMAACAVLCLAGSASAQGFVEQFDTYNLGFLAAQSPVWEEWDGSMGVDANVVNNESYTEDQCVEITGMPAFGMNGNDVVYDFSNLAGGQPTSGVWLVHGRVFVPSGATGIGWFIMLNRYPNAKNWSLQIHFDADNGIVHAAEPAGTDTPLIFDEWVNFVTAIDLDNDRVDFFYGGAQVCDDQPWRGNGDVQVACIDLYGGEPASGGISGFYYDNIRVESSGGPGSSLSSSPGPAPDGGMVTINYQAPQSPNGKVALYLYEVNGNPLILKILIANLDASGNFSITGTLPGGVAPLDLGFRAFSIAQGGGPINQSNLDLMLIR